MIVSDGWMGSAIQWLLQSNNYELVGIELLQTWEQNFELQSYHHHKTYLLNNLILQ